MTGSEVRDGPERPYRSFWQGGFEGADHVNGSGTPLCMNTASGHLRHLDDDYARAARLGLRTVRESAGWRSLERNGQLDLSSVALRARAARAHGVQVLWTCMHYGVPSGLDIFSDHFVTRFADYCHQLATLLRPFHDGPEPPVYTPINEISFLCWAVCQTGLIHPYIGDRGYLGYPLKQHLVRAAIAGSDAILAADPRARFLTVDPLVHITSRDALRSDEARRHHDYQFQACDMLGGLAEPQLGGSPRYLDLVGVNYYPDNQWLIEDGGRLDWPAHPQRRCLSELLVEVHARYGRPLTLSETSHVGPHRSAWLTDVVRAVDVARAQGVQVDGLCLYPASDRPDWERPEHWHRSGLWHVRGHALRRRINRPYALALQRARGIAADAPPSSTPSTHPLNPTSPGAPWTP